MKKKTFPWDDPFYDNTPHHKRVFSVISILLSSIAYLFVLTHIGYFLLQQELFFIEAIGAALWFAFFFFIIGFAGYTLFRDLEWYVALPVWSTILFGVYLLNLFLDFSQYYRP